MRVSGIVHFEMEENEMKEDGEIRSWDMMRGDIQPLAQLEDIPVRVVVWPKGAPKQEDVPQAGERVMYIPQSRKCTVVTGIPCLNREGTRWSLRVVDEVGSIFTASPYELGPIPEPEPRTYTEDEIRSNTLVERFN
ncbi:MAG: hypothetical protein V3T23_01680 [Nitrososphaerales archaeon]